MIKKQISKPSSLSPKEFTRLWNLLLKKSKTAIAHGTDLPKTVLAFEDEKGLYEKLSFVVDRVNTDSDFIQELNMYTREKVCFSIVCENCQIQIEANRIEAR